MSSSAPATSLNPGDALGLRAAIEQAHKSLAEGGIPIGSSLVVRSDSVEGGEPKYEVLAVGHNQRMQKGSPTLHGETAMLEAAGRLKAEVYRRSTIVSS